jgi:trimethylamine--corrinoid protein Co-methyltransferase
MTDKPAQTLNSRLTFLSEEKCEAIYDGALTIIADIGMIVPHAGARRLLADAGATVDDADRVRIPRELVAQARATIPAIIDVYDREGELAMQLGRRNSYFGTGSDLMSIYDLETGERRESRLTDVARQARLCDGLPHIDFVMSSAYPNDIEPYAAYLESFRAMVSNTTKPMVMTAAGPEDLEVMWKIACALRGGAEELRAKPYFVQYGEPVSPLQHSVEVIDKLLFCADWGIPLIYSPAPIAGATAPITHAGHIVQALAESLFGAVIHQLRRPGSPLLTGMGPVKLDMNTVQALYNSAEYYTTYLGMVEMAKWMDVPNWGYAGTSDSQCVDAQAGLDIAELTLLSMQAGSNLNHDIGYLDFGLTCAPELVVIVEEVVSLNRRVLEGIVVDEETLGLDVIAAVGPGGDYLRTKHTKQFVRGLQWKPTILNRVTQKAWEDEGSPDLRDKARRKALDILAGHEPQALDAAAKEAMDELVAAYVASHK